MVFRVGWLRDWCFFPVKFSPRASRSSSLKVVVVVVILVVVLVLLVVVTFCKDL